ncbi:unnamed protein product [Bursaphelenchus xylophilus]|uniref:(pine wood nematode) hypothetical protein n=1 Tax=Bursaphelenchus xylophilus TaxID=6326 RepID=A0A1I7RZR2_BURXY|nr:unnamed protein product [Bursaphelenchus xylophilus]CAG9111582.1 unnamed protein product [Bursaphelenchus xylophilus]
MWLPSLLLLLCTYISANELADDSLPVCNCTNKPTKDYYYDLDTHMDTLPELECRPCLEGSKCVQVGDKAQCQCAPYRFGQYCQYADLCHNGRSKCVDGDCKSDVNLHSKKCICNDDRGGEFCEFQRPKEQILLTFEVMEPMGIQNILDGLSVVTKNAHLGGFDILESGKAMFKSTGNLCMKQKVDQNEDIDPEAEGFVPYNVIVHARILMACGRLAEHHHTEIFTCYTSAYDAVHTLNNLRLYDQTKRFGLNFVHAEVDNSLFECQHAIGLIIGLLAVVTLFTVGYCLYQRISYQRYFRGSGARGAGSGDTMNKLIEPNGYF